MNFVEVTGQPVDFEGGPVSSSLHFFVNDWVWDQSANMCSAGSPIDVETYNGSPSWTIPLLAMDNTGVSTNWSWCVSGEINGIAVPARKLIVNYANGPAQHFADLLQTSTLL